MLAFLQTNTPIVIFNQIVVTLLTVCFLYQVVFFVLGALRGEVAPPQGQKAASLCLLYRGCITRRP